MFTKSISLPMIATALCCLTAALSATDVSSVQLNTKVQADGMTLGADNYLYVASAWEGKTISKIDPSSGAVIEFAAGLKGPIDITQAEDGSFYTTNWQGQKITHIAPDGTIKDFATVGPKGDGVATDSEGNLWFTSGSTREIKKIAPDGTVATVAQGGILKYPLGIAITENDEVFVGAGQAGEIYKLNENQEPELFATVPGPGPWRIGHLLFAKGRLFASGLNSNKVFEVHMDGTVDTLAGSGQKGHADGPSTEATFDFPASLAMSADGKYLYVFSASAPTNKLRRVEL